MSEIQSGSPEGRPEQGAAGSADVHLEYLRLWYSDKHNMRKSLSIYFPYFFMMFWGFKVLCGKENVIKLNEGETFTNVPHCYFLGANAFYSSLQLALSILWPQVRVAAGDWQNLIMECLAIVWIPWSQMSNSALAGRFSEGYSLHTYPLSGLHSAAFDFPLSLRDLKILYMLAVVAVDPIKCFPAPRRHRRVVFSLRVLTFCTPFLYSTSPPTTMLVLAIAKMMFYSLCYHLTRLVVLNVLRRLAPKPQMDAVRLTAWKSSDVARYNNVAGLIYGSFYGLLLFFSHSFHKNIEEATEEGVLFLDALHDMYTTIINDVKAILEPYFPVIIYVTLAIPVHLMQRRREASFLRQGGTPSQYACGDTS